MPCQGTTAGHKLPSLLLPWDNQSSSIPHLLTNNVSTDGSTMNKNDLLIGHFKRRHQVVSLMGILVLFKFTLHADIISGT